MPLSHVATGTSGPSVHSTPECSRIDPETDVSLASLFNQRALPAMPVVPGFSTEDAVFSMDPFGACVISTFCVICLI